MEFPKNHFEYHIEVKPEAIDQLNHVNNEVYLKWMMEAAIGHSAFLGFNLEKFRSVGGFFVVRRHEIDYLASAHLGEKLKMVTWITETTAARAIREYVLIRERDQKTLLKGKTHWVFIDLKSGIPGVIPDVIKAAYDPNA